MPGNEYVLHIDIQNLQSDKSRAKERLASSNGKSSGDGRDKKKNDKLNKSVNALAKKAVLTTVNDIAKPLIEFQINSYSARYGNSVRANTVKNIQTVADAATEIGSMALAGASVGGGWGALIFAVLGVAKQGVDIAQNIITYDSKQQVYKFEEIRASERLGLMLSDRNRNR